MKNRQLMKKVIQLNKYGKTRSNQKNWANQTRKNVGGPRNINDCSTGNEKENKNNAPYIPKKGF